eukprot:CAMPEP_0202442680 /NCGR_PEP_ID=MMETSP1360-20130828/2064_1 /ASSEMBLY_ACC=CAM_ASM_000848 /TAXON_ID=515479 /ORGANISM="Licmophora paradoxa, Strain CCMP2313" /LENGTH=47 /DNA_ID= /DNA_START= /DNA_END= /DNA_ORIENTATION=
MIMTVAAVDGVAAAAAVVVTALFDKNDMAIVRHATIALEVHPMNSPK